MPSIKKISLINFNRIKIQMTIIILIVEKIILKKIKNNKILKI